MSTRLIITCDHSLCATSVRADPIPPGRASSAFVARDVVDVTSKALANGWQLGVELAPEVALRRHHTRQAVLDLCPYHRHDEEGDDDR